MSTQYDIIVIGAGPAGESAAELAAYFGQRVAIIEQNKPGGTVTTRGGAPTKTLREAALVLTGFYDQKIYGVELGAPPALALDKVAERTRQVCQAVQAAAAHRLAQMGITYFHGMARLAPGGKVLFTPADNADNAAEVTMSARIILIATGTRPLRPANLPFADPAVFDVDGIFGLTALPKSLCIVGGGPVGIEFATIFNALGASVTLIQKGDRLAPTMDGELAHRMAQLFAERGVRVILGAGVETVVRVGAQLHLTLSNGDPLTTEALLLAAGRSPYTAGLGLADIGIAVDKSGYIIVDENYQTRVPGVYAAGDVVGAGLASVAMEQGRVAACEALGLNLLERVDPIPISAIYGVPELAGVGLTEEQCQAQGIAYGVGRSNFANLLRGVISGHDGWLKLIYRQDDLRLLGVHCLGEMASELIGIGQMVLHYGGTIETFGAIILATPTYSYAYKHAAFDALHQAKQILTPHMTNSKE